MNTKSILWMLLICAACDASKDDIEPIDADGDGYTSDVDCDDDNRAVYPGADERCDGLDNDCDEIVDEDPTDPTVYFRDSDGDTYGNPTDTLSACTAPEGYVADDSDCDDTDAAIHPGAFERCDDLDVDEDCDGLINDDDDNLDESSLLAWVPDADGDGFGDASAAPVLQCSAPEGDIAYLTDATDCDDSNLNIHPDASEVCDDWDLDEDCDGLAEDKDPDVDESTYSTWYPDRDEDGYGADEPPIFRCDAPTGGPIKYADNNQDCDESDPELPASGNLLCLTVGRASATFSGEVAGGHFGWSVSTAGDINGDGYSDVIIGAPYMDGTVEDAGTAFIYLGSATGIRSLKASEADATLKGDVYYGMAGYSVSTAGDVNGDGYDDVIVGAPNHIHWNSGGDAYIVHGSSTGISDMSLSKADTLMYDDVLDGYEHSLAWRVQTAGDINGDGYDDVLVGHPFSQSARASYNKGFAYVMLGSSTGIDDADMASDPDVTLTGEDYEMAAGYSVAAGGDVDADGISDLVVGAPDWQPAAARSYHSYGRAYIVLGATSGIADMTLDNADTTLDGSYNDGRAGSDAQSAGDVNGDGYDDIIVGAPGADDVGKDAGSAYVFFGASTGIASANLVDADIVLTGEDSLHRAGWRTRSAGDFDNDGHDDLLISAVQYSAGSASRVGAVYVVLGDAMLYGTHSLSDADGRLTGQNNRDELGLGLSTAGDVNNDGYSDFLVGVPEYSSSVTTAGAVYLIQGF